MKIILAGGTGQVGTLLYDSLKAKGHEVLVLARGKPVGPQHRQWDGKNLGVWQQELENCDVVINLAGRSVNCRYTDENLNEMLTSRTESTKVLGDAIAASKNPPKLWLQMTTATIYAHTLGPANDEHTGVIGGRELGVPAYWKTSIDIATAWEEALFAAPTPSTRKVALRAAMVMTPKAGGVFRTLLMMVRLGLGGPIGGGTQYVSWIHGEDFVRAVEFLIAHDEITGVVNFAAPGPLPQRDFMAVLRTKWGRWLGLPATRWMAEIGAFFLRTDTELLLKSRRVVPTRLLESGFKFKFPDWESAAADLVANSRKEVHS